MLRIMKETTREKRNIMSNQFFAEVVQGDPLTLGIEFKDEQGVAVDLTGWEFNASFKESYRNTGTVFDLTWNNEVTFKDDDPTTGVVLFGITAEKSIAVSVDTYTASPEDTPFKDIVGDVKITPPVNVDLEIVSSTRPRFVLKVFLGITE